MVGVILLVMAVAALIAAALIIVGKLGASIYLGIIQNIIIDFIMLVVCVVVICGACWLIYKEYVPLIKARHEKEAVIMVSNNHDVDNSSIYLYSV